MEILGAIASYLGGALLAAVAGLGLVLGPPAAALALASASSSFAERRLLSLLGPRAYLASLGWLGTAIHELAHAGMCLVFRHRIRELRLFDPSLRTGAVGYVDHEWDRRSLYQKVGNLFIGLAPLLVGAALLAAAARLLLPDPTLPRETAGEVPDTWNCLFSFTFSLSERTAAEAAGLASRFSPGDWRSWLLLYLAVAVGPSMNLSPADLKGSLHGLGVLVALAVLVAVATRWAWDWSSIPVSQLVAVQGPLLALLLLVSGLNLALGLAALALARLIRARA